MAKLRKMLTHPGKNESGQGVLAIVLILLMLGAIILTPLLVFMSTGLKAGGVYESKMQEFYAADAGVEDAIWNITYANLTTPANYTLADEVNNRTTNVTIVSISSGGYSGYKIISTATSDSGGNTTIECNYGALDFSSLLDHAITSNDTVCIKGDVNGSVVARNCTCEHGPAYPNCTLFDELAEPINWPSKEQLSAWYWDQVKDLAPYSKDYIDIDTTPIIPLYRNGTLDVYNKGIAGKNTTLNGTVYVTGSMTIGTTQHDFTLNLNNRTIYCESNINVGGKCTITGSGCIIALGDVYFEPKSTVAREGDFIFIMSVEGTVTLQPNGNFYGAVAGDTDVSLQPGNILEWRDLGEGGNFNFPTGKAKMKVLSYTIK
jgi:hypothetical protein